MGDYTVLRRVCPGYTECAIIIKDKHLEMLKKEDNVHKHISLALDEYYDPKTKHAKRLIELSTLEILKEIDSTAKI